MNFPFDGTPKISRGARVRKPHVVSDHASRVLKARKIVSIIGQQRFVRSHNVLEVGCGSGGISSALARMDGVPRRFEAVDVVDSRSETDGFTFTLVHGTTLPFPDGAFDLVITNHVIEHVGDEAAQIRHLSEVRRVTAPDGIIYFAVPNKWRLVEPHYRLPLLSWFPARISDAYARVARHADYYDCFPRSKRQLERLFRTTELMYSDVTLNALHATLELEHPGHPLTRLVNYECPEWLLQLGMPIVPTLIFLLRRPESDPRDRQGRR